MSADRRCRSLFEVHRLMQVWGGVGVLPARTPTHSVMANLFLLCPIKPGQDLKTAVWAKNDTSWYPVGSSIGAQFNLGPLSSSATVAILRLNLRIYLSALARRRAFLW